MFFVYLIKNKVQYERIKNWCLKMENMESLQLVLLNMFVLTIFVIMLLLALTTSTGIFEATSLPPLPL